MEMYAKEVKKYGMYALELLPIIRAIHIGLTWSQAMNISLSPLLVPCVWVNGCGYCRKLQNSR